jgi:type II secretory pathway component GspD/PulD (secretin)
LNRLIAQGTSQDMEQIEGYLAIIDKDSSIADVRTYGRSQVIELRYTRAKEVAEAIRAAFAGRVAAAAPASGAASGAGAATAAPPPGDERARRESEGSDEDKKAATAKKSSAGAAARNLEPTMTLAIHEPSNSLIVTAPEKLVDEVRALVDQIDSRSEQTVEILAADSTAVLQAILQQGRSGSRDSGRSSSSSSRSSSSSSSSNSQLWEMLRSRSGR